jgi:flagellar assembly protein FliH
MSKVLPCDSSAKCTTWQAPSFESEQRRHGAGNNGSHNGETREQQEQHRRRIHEQAFARGYSEGLEKGQKEMREQAAYLESLMTGLVKPLRNLDKQVVDDLVQLCMAVVRQLVRRELKISPDEVIAVVKEALNQLPVAAGEIRLELHPEDAVLVRKMLGGAEAETPWRIVEDPVLSRGGCKVSTSASRIDATVENRINAAIAAVIGGDRHVD